MKRKLFSVVLSIFCLVFLASCLDYVQSISYKDGEYHNYYKITVSKILMEMAEEDVDDYILELQNMADSSFPAFVSVKPVNTDLEVGVEIAFSINLRGATEEERVFLPAKTGNKYFIPFVLGNEFTDFDDFDSTDYESEAIAMAMLSTAKCRVMLGKNIVPSISIAYFAGTGGKNFSIPVFDYGTAYCLEIPFTILFENSMYDFEKIIVLK